MEYVYVYIAAVVSILALFFGLRWLFDGIDDYEDDRDRHLREFDRQGCDDETWDDDDYEKT